MNRLIKDIRQWWALYIIAILFGLCVGIANGGWDYHYWTQEEVDQYIPEYQWKVGRVWWQKWNGDGNADTSNLPAEYVKPLVISGTVYGAPTKAGLSIVNGVDVTRKVARPIAWNSKTIDIQWTDDLRDEWVTIGTWKVGPGCAPAHFFCRIEEPWASYILNSQSGFFRVVGNNRDAYVYSISVNENRIITIVP